MTIYIGIALVVACLAYMVYALMAWLLTEKKNEPLRRTWADPELRRKKK